jgi:tetratricopeptide (TPR) repeat protein
MTTQKRCYLLANLFLLLSITLTSCGSNSNNTENIANPNTNANTNAKNVDRPVTTGQSTSQISPIVSTGKKSIRGYELYQKVDEVSNWLKQGKYQEIEQFFQTAIAEKKLTAAGRYYAVQVLDRIFEDSDVAKSFDAGWQIYLDRWLDKSPNSSLAYLFRGIFYYNYAWEIRGNKFISKTSEEARQGFREKMRLSVEDIAKSLSIDAENSLTSIEVLRISNSIGMPREEFEAFFQKAIALVPNAPEAYAAKTLYLQPQWHGSEAELLTFVRESVNSAPQGSAIPAIVKIAYSGLCASSGLNRQEYFNRPEVWQEIQASYDRLIKEFPESGYYAFQYAQLARQTGREDIAQYNYNLAWEREPNHPLINRELSRFVR